jgi:hypothetical protein
VRRVNARAARGAAAVETALSLLVLIPVFLYALFLDDMLRHVLDAQEAALSTIWDFTVQDYAKEPTNGEPFDGYSNVAGYARFMYCDHESGSDSFDTGVKPRECSDDIDSEDHHQEVVAHACWLIPGAQQIQCTLNDEQVGAYGVSLHQSYMDEFGRGGLVRCSARIGVQNYLLQRSVFAEFTRVGLAKDKQERSDGIHNNATSGHDGNAYLLPREQLSIVTDTWALTRPNADIRPGSKEGQFFDRVAHVYTNQDNQGYTQMQRDAERVVREGVQNQQLAQGLQLSDSTPSGDDPRQPSIGISPQTGSEPEERIEQKGRQQGYFNNEWRDWGSNNNERTYQARGNWYLGCSREESC